MQKTDIPNPGLLTFPDLEWPDFSALELELESCALYTTPFDWPDLAWTRLVAVSLAANVTRGPGWCCIPLRDAP
jgi:hypothetical protein